MKSHSHIWLSGQDAPTSDAHTMKSVKSDLTYRRYTDWDSSSDIRTSAVDARDERSSNSYERHATYVNDVRDRDATSLHSNHRHEQHLLCEHGSNNASRRGRIAPQDQFMSPTSCNAVQSFQPNTEDETSVRTSITNSRSVTSPERRRRNSRYEPAPRSHSGSTVGSRDVMPSVVRTRSKNRTSNNHGSTSVKTSQNSKHHGYWSQKGGFPDVNSFADESRLPGQSNCYSSVKPPLGPKIQDTTPRINNTISCGNTVDKNKGKLRHSNTSISSFTRDDDTVTLENSIPSALEFVAKSVMSANSRHNSSNPDQGEMSYWIDLSVRAAICVIEAKGSEALAEKAATTVVEVGSKIKLREKKRDMHQVLRFLATKTSVALLEAGGNQRVATAVAHAIMTHNTIPDDLETVNESTAEIELDRSTMLSHIDRSISKNMKRSKGVTRISDLSDVQKDELSKKVKDRGTQFSQQSENRRDAVVSNKNDPKKPAPQTPQKQQIDQCSMIKLPSLGTQTTDASKNSDITISKSNLSFEKSSQHAESQSRSQSLSAKEKAIEEAARLNAQREQELNEKMAALDAATNDLLVKATNVQQYIDQQVALKQRADGQYYPAGISKEFQAAFSCDDPGYHHNFNGRSFQVDDKYRNHFHGGRGKEKSVFEKLTNGLAQMLEFTCTAPTTGTHASSGNFTTQSPNLNYNGGMMDHNYSDTYAYSEKNDDANDIISVLTEEMPSHKRWQQNSRLTLITDHQRLSDYTRAKQPMHTAGFSQNQASAESIRITTPPLVDHTPVQHTEPKVQVDETNAKESPPIGISPGTANNVGPPTNQSIHHAFDTAMQQLAMQQLSTILNEEPHSDPNKAAAMTDTTQKPRSSSIGKLRSAFTKKKTPKSVTFGANTDGPPVTPKSPGRMFFGRRRNEPN